MNNNAADVNMLVVAQENASQTGASGVSWGAVLGGTWRCCRRSCAVPDTLDAGRGTGAVVGITMVL